MRAKYQAKVPQMAQNYDASKSRAIQNYRGPQGVTIGPQTRAAYADGMQRARLELPPDAADKMIRNYVDKMSR